jgi:MoxR-like ATPase
MDFGDDEDLNYWDEMKDHLQGSERVSHPFPSMQEVLRSVLDKDMVVYPPNVVKPSNRISVALTMNEIEYLVQLLESDSEDEHPDNEPLLDRFDTLLESESEPEDFLDRRPNLNA